VRPGLPVEVEEIIRQAIAKDPADRFQSGEALAQALRRAAADLTAADVTRFAPPEATISLATQWVPEAVAAEPSSLGRDLTALPGEARIVIARKGEPPQSHTLVKDANIVGRAPGSEIVLDDEAVSRQHTRLERLPDGGWQVVDLGSTNGTYMEDARLLPDIPELWEPGVTVRIGPYFLRLERIAAAATAAFQGPFPAPGFAAVPAAADPAERVPAAAQVTVRPIEQFTIDMRPNRVSHGGVVRVLVRNDGNDEADYTVVGRDPAEAIDFQGQPARLRLAPAGRGTVDLRLLSRRRPWLGSTQTLPYTIFVSTPGGGQQSLSGQLDVPARLPRFAVPLLGALLIILCVALGVLFAFANSRDQQATRTAEAIVGGQIAATQTAQGLATATAQSEAAVAETGTVLAVTAQAAGDDDNDGLSNAQEQPIGTDPNNPDSDNDGLLDGQEVNQTGTEPLQQDSDGDALADGPEVDDYGTSPTNPDSDGDGVPDGAEVAAGTDPLLPPTATPPPTVPPTSAPATPTPSATPTATPAAADAAILVFADDTGLYATGLHPSGDNVETGEITQLAAGDGIVSVSISPDGERVAFLQELINSNNQLVVINLDGTGLIVVADSGELSQDPVPPADPAETRRIVSDYQWLADSERLAFNTNTVSLTGPGSGENGDLWLVTPGSEPSEQFAPGELGGSLAISDGNVVLSATGTEVLRANVDGSGRESLISFPSVATYSEYIYYPVPQWVDGDTAHIGISSPDPIFGEAFIRLWRIPASGPAAELNSVPGNALFAPVSWSPDGGQLAYVRQIPDPTNPPAELYIGNADGSDLTHYGPVEQGAAFLTWSANSANFLFTTAAEDGDGNFHLGRADGPAVSRSIPSGEHIPAAVPAAAGTIVFGMGNESDWRLFAINGAGGTHALADLNGRVPVIDVWLR
jgi:hypothetical protein